MSRQDWLRGVKRTPQEFDTLVYLIVQSRSEKNWTAQQIAERFAPYNGQMKPDVNRVLRSMKRLHAAGRVTLGHYSRGWFNYYYVREKENG